MNEPDYRLIGLRIKRIRLQKDMSQETLASNTGLTTVHISNIENAHTKLSLPAIISIANALEVSVDELLSDNLKCFEDSIDFELRDVMLDCSPVEWQYLKETLRDTKERLRSYYTIEKKK